MALINVFLLLGLACHFDVVFCMGPLPALAFQPVRQAGEAIAVNVDYDVPAFGPDDVGIHAQQLSDIEDGVPGQRIHSRKSPSFLGTKVLPVDSDRITSSLYLTKPLRSPPKATVNIIMHEDVQTMKDASKYKGMLDQTAALQHEFRKGLADKKNWRA